MKTYKRKTVKTLQRVLADLCEHTIKVTRLGAGWNIRLFLNGILQQESRVYDRQHISPEIKDMLRMEDKCGNLSDMADKSRHRHKSLV